MVKTVCARLLLYGTSLSLVSEKAKRGCIVCKLKNNKHLQNFILNLNNQHTLQTNTLTDVNDTMSTNMFQKKTQD